MMNFIMMERRKMKKALLKKIPVVEAGIKDKQYMELCRHDKAGLFLEKESV